MEKAGSARGKGQAEPERPLAALSTEIRRGQEAGA